MNSQAAHIKKKHYLSSFLVSLLFFNNLVYAQDSNSSADHKEKIAQFQTRILKANNIEKSTLMVELAKLYYKDQEEEKAFQTFLEALQEIPSTSTTSSPTADELVLYKNGLKLYLDNPGAAALQTAKQLQKEYEPQVHSHPNYYLLNFLVAAAYANQGNLEEFFDRFYLSYQQYPHSYMAFKTKTILHLKLFERARTDEVRELHRKAILENANKALEKDDSDTSLYKITLMFMGDKEGVQILNKTISAIIQKNIIIPRMDICFYTHEALEHQHKALAQHFVTKAREWYQQSKQIEQAQQMIDDFK